MSIKIKNIKDPNIFSSLKHICDYLVNHVWKTDVLGDGETELEFQLATTRSKRYQNDVIALSKVDVELEWGQKKIVLKDGSIGWKKVGDFNPWYKGELELNKLLNSLEHIVEFINGNSILEAEFIQHYNFLKKYSEQGIFPPSLTSVEKIITKQEAGQEIRPSIYYSTSLGYIADLHKEQLYDDELQLIKKLLQICNEQTKSVVLIHPSIITENDPDTAGFSNLETVRDLYKKYSVFLRFNKPLPDKLPDSLIIEAQIDFSKLKSRAERLHDEIESWKGKVYGIEQQKKFIFNRLMDYIRKSPHQNNEPYEYSERILGTYTPVNDNYPLGMSLSRPDPNRVDIKFQFMRAMRELEKDGHIEILGVDFDFNAQPIATTASVEASKWSLGERSKVFYPARHCHVKFRLKPVNKLNNTSVIPLPKDVVWQKNEYKWTLLFKDGRKLEFLNPKLPTVIYFDLLINNHGNEIKHKKVMEVIENIKKVQIENLVKALRKKIKNSSLSDRIKFTTNYEGGYTLHISEK